MKSGEVEVMNIYKMGMLVGLLSMLGTQLVAGEKSEDNFFVGLARPHVENFVVRKTMGLAAAAVRRGLYGLATNEGAALAGINQESFSTIKKMVSYAQNSLSFLQWLSGTNTSLPIVGLLGQNATLQTLFKYGPAALGGIGGALG